MAVPGGVMPEDSTREWRRIGVLFPARYPANPENWSGSPAGIASGLASLGYEVVPIGTATLSMARIGLSASRVFGSSMVAQHSDQRVRIRSVVLARSVKQAGRLDALVAMGTDAYDLGRVRDWRVPTATFDDATLLQQWRNKDSDIRGAGFPEGAVRRWCANQAVSSRASDVCCVSTSWAATSFIEDYGVPTERVSVVGVGHHARSTAARNDRDWSRPRFLFVGVDWRRKNGDAVLRAFSEVRALHPDAQLDVVGMHPVLDQVGVTGHGLLRRDDPDAQGRLDQLFMTATAFVLPSRFDPAGIAYLEAASSGLPVIATTEGGAGELLGEAALSVHPDDHATLTAAMSTLCEPGTAQFRGALAAKRAAESTWTSVARRILDALDDARLLPGAGSP
jgi:glycosyltransferase involved in cell wall biosynthesis